jgi:hypothetical protein
MINLLVIGLWREKLISKGAAAHLSARSYLLFRI